MYRIYEKKEGKKYVETYRTEDELEIYKSLASELMYCKIWKSPIYNRMKERNNYDGTRTVTFYQTNGGRSIYKVKL